MAGLTFSRTPQQMLNVVYLNSNGTPIGFFPNGLNDKLRYAAQRPTGIGSRRLIRARRMS
ncbi:hypothetical protein MKK55_10025 [Methylobacterium sp. J-059]|uniref:hypothetical protein n=1 Tax=Methylobacterium sp. J-059 TaxID=2836643 RepID=UPI001FB98601|nr:hypothetical protein [Methylobacterium sp. J-059]MCJ2039275.1 hypothetical protein [Methylobacterium sp. J-059]